MVFPRALALVFTLALLPVIVVLALYVYLQIFQIIFPGVTVAGAPVDGFSRHEAEEELDRIWNQEYWITAVDTMAAENAWLVDPGEFGLLVDPQTTAEMAYAVGRQGGLLSNVQQLLGVMFYGCDIQPVVILDQARAREGLTARAEVLDEHVVEGDVRFEDGNVTVVEAQTGKMLDIDATLLLLAGDPRSVLVEYRFLPLLTVPVDPMVTAVVDAAEQARRYLYSGFAIDAFDPVTGEFLDWTPTFEARSAWLQLETSGSELSVSIDPDAVSATLNEYNQRLGSERTVDVLAVEDQVIAAIENGETVSLTVHYLPTTYVVRSTDNIISIAFNVGIPYWRIQEANPILAAQGLTTGETITIPPKDVNLVVPPVENKRIVISISEQHMWTYENGELRSEHVVSTGMSNSPTMPGVFQIQIHILNAYGENWDLYMPHFLGIYEAVPGFMNGIHGLPLLSNGVRLWGNVLGSPASYGCIILDLLAAEDVYNWAENGVVVEILP